LHLAARGGENFASPVHIQSHALQNVATHLTDEDFNLQKPLEHFRAKTKRLKIHPLEASLLWVVALHLVFLPWAIGGMRLWGQLVSLSLALISFGLALIPRHYTAAHTGANTFHLVPWPRATTASSNATTSAGRPLARIIRHDKGGGTDRPEERLGGKLVLEVATRRAFGRIPGKLQLEMKNISPGRDKSC
jgi:hypothetical protein